MTIAEKEAMATYRSRQQELGALGCAMFFVLLGAFFLWDFSTGEMGWGGLLIFELPLVLFVAGNVRCMLTKVQVRGDRLRIVNVRRTYELPLASVERFAMGSRGFFSRIGIAELRDGSSVAMFAIQGPNPATRPNNRSAEDAIDDLNAHLRVGAAA